MTSWPIVACAGSHYVSSLRGGALKMLAVADEGGVVGLGLTDVSKNTAVPSNTSGELRP